MNEELISIIVPIFNSVNTISRCVDSILNQTYKNMEIILIDDGSNDGSYEICEDYLKKDSRIKLLHQKNYGVSRARNLGLLKSRGKYIGFIDSDDYIETNMLEKLYRNMKCTKSQIAICNFFYEDDNGTEILTFSHKSFKFKKNEFPQNIFNIPCINGYLWNKLYDRNLLISKEKQMLLLDENIRILEDNLYNYQIYKENSEFDSVFINEKLYHYVQYTNSTCNKKFNYNQLQYFWVREKQIEILCNKNVDATFLKADFVVAFLKAKIKIKILNLEKNEIYEQYLQKYNQYKKNIDIGQLTKKMKLKFFICKYFPIIYKILIYIKKENI